ncbi:MAG: hypothetical protein ACR2GI_01425 [Thermomicrobiales bacterium]
MNVDTEPASTTDREQTQRLAIGWGAGLFLGIGIGGALAFALSDMLTGIVVALAITLVVAGAYLLAGHSTAERRAAHIVAREDFAEDDEDDDGTY